MNLFFRKTGSGPPVVILHGLFGMSDNWQTIARLIGERGHAVFCVDLRNHGQSFHHEEFNYNLMAKDLFQLFSSEGILFPDIIGHSMGGKAAMAYAFLHPENMGRLIVVDIAPRYYKAQHKHIVEALKAIDFTKVKTRKAAEMELERFNIDSETRQFLLKNLYWKTENSLAWRFNLPVIERNMEEVGREIRNVEPFQKPALFIRGEKSDYINEADRVEILNFFPKSIILTAPNSGHWVHADNPSWFVENVLEFLDA